jgi:hypothetical protein
MDLRAGIPYTESQINALDRVQKKADKFANHTNGSVWKTLAQRRRQLAYAPVSKRTLENGHGKLYGTGYKDHVT